jgi:hypothetical protein
VRRGACLLPGVLLCSLILTVTGRAAGAGRPISEVEVAKQAQQPGLAGLPSSAPKPIVYFLSGANAPSCGLLQAGAGVITPILETDPDSNFPFCSGIDAGAPFSFHDTQGYVFRYIQRDTREDTSTQYFFVLATSGGLSELDALNEDTPPAGKSMRYIAAWGKARLAAQEGEKQAFQPSKADSIVTESGFLDVSRDSGSGRCRADVDTVTTDSHFAAIVVPCEGILASTVLSEPTGTYFVLLTRAKNTSQGHIFVVTSGGVRETPEFERTLSRDIAKGQVLIVKTALRRLLAQQ